MLLILMSFMTATAAVETNLPYNGTRNLPPDDSYAFFDFEEGTGHFDSLLPSQYADIKFTNIFANNRDHIWSYNDAQFPLMHVYPQNVFFQDDKVTPVNYIYLIQGRYAASTVVELYPGGFYTGVYGLIEFPEGANHVSFLVSSGEYFKATAFDKRGNQIGYASVPTTIYRVSLPNGPSTWSRVSFNRTKSDIYSIEIRGQCNDWLIDDLVIGGLPLDDTPEPVDYSDVAAKALTALNALYLEYGFGFDYRDFSYADVEDILNPPPNCAPGLNCPDGLEYWNPDTKRFEYGEGISNVGLVIWAFNSITRELYGESVVKWDTTPSIAKNDFTVPVPIGEEQPGDVYFLYGGEHGAVDEIGIVVDDTSVVTSRPEEGVTVISKTSIEGTDTPNPDFAGYYRLPGVIHGGHSPIKKHPPNK